LTPLVVFLAASALPAGVASSRDPASLVVHEWGTFTSVAGDAGEPIDWWSLGGVQDLPCFVQKFRAIPKSSVGGAVRMETPVLYFYAPQDMTVDVSVKFKQGIMTEWFPRARVSPDALSAAGFTARDFAHDLTWSSVRITPGAKEDYPRERRPSHYYAARETDASPIQVDEQREKFLFYRGVGRVPIPVAVRVDENGRLRIINTGPDALPIVIAFENRAGRIGYRIRHHVTGEIALDPPALDARFVGLAAELEKTLVAQGLYDQEARAMIETWRDSWFEEGTRVFYIVPPKLIDDALPLTMEPRPSQVRRVFVGRVELITSAMKSDVADAIAQHNPKAAAKYGRFLPSVVDRMFPPGTHHAERLRAERVLQSVHASHTLSSCSSRVPGF